MGLLHRFFSAECLVPADRICGEIPSTRQAYRDTLSVAWPAALEAFLVALIASVDTIMVGSIGPSAISAVGITTQPKYVVLSLVLSLNVGITTIVARRRGEGDRASANTCLRQGILLSSLLSLVLGALAFRFAGPILTFAGAGSDILADAVLYFRIILVGNFFYSISLTINAAQRGSGNTKVSMVTNLTANVVNLIFNYLLINGVFFFPRLGVMGAALATALGNLVAFVMSFYTICHHASFLQLELKGRWMPDSVTFRQILHISSGAMVEQLVIRVGLFSYAKTVAVLGTVPFAAHQVGMNVLNISYSFGDGLGIAASAMVGQNLGATRPDLSILYARACHRIGVIIAVVLLVVFIAFRYPIVAIFNNDPEILRLGAPLIIINGIACLSQIPSTVHSGGLRGSGDVRYVAILSFFSIGLVRSLLSWFLCHPLGLGLMGAWYGLLADQIVRQLLYGRRFNGLKWTEIVL